MVLYKINYSQTEFAAQQIHTAKIQYFFNIKRKSTNTDKNKLSASSKR